MANDMNDASMTEQEKRNIDTIKRILGGFTKQGSAQLDELVHPEFINHHAPEGMQDRAGFREIVAQVSGLFGSFDAMTLEPLVMFCRGDHVAMIDQGKGEKNGKAYSHVDLHVFIMKDGMLWQHWNSFGLPCQRDTLMRFVEEAGA